MDATRIVVGVDGSAASLTGMRWAAAEAQHRDADLEVVLAYHWRMPGVRERHVRARVGVGLRRIEPAHTSVGGRAGSGGGAPC